MDLQQKTKPSTQEGLVDKILFCHIKQCYVGRHSGLMVSAFFSRLSSLGSSPGQGHCIVFSGVTLNSQSASLHPGVQIGTSNFNAGGNSSMEWHPNQGGVEILLVASCYRNRRKAPP